MKLSIGKKMFAGFFVVLFILAITVTIAYFQISAVDRSYTVLIEDKAQKLIMIQELNWAIKKEQAELREYLLIGDEAALKSFNDSHSQYLSMSKALGDIIVISDAKKLFQEMDQLEGQYYQLANREIQLKQQNKTEEYTNLLLTEGRDTIQKFDKKIDELTTFQQNILKNGNEETSSKVTSIKKWMMLMGLLAVLLGVIIAFYIGLAERVAIYGITGKRNERVDQSHCKKGKKRTRSLFSRFMTS
ncbi:MCP four helix bundle domain-containing protein, partial [Paenibacillus doosanensis]|uniref:CHASE3 domain-containing protein n=1 Tax=Paenibacillus doosanensis TaxID=1229154 RepID=UPI0021807EF0